MPADRTDSPAQRELNIAFLICDEPAEPTLKKHGGFDDMLHNLLEPLMQKEHDHVKLITKGYDVVEKREYPSREQLETIDCVCISGSFVEDAGADTPWIARLAGFIVYLHDEWPRIRLVGICFVIARAFGARVEPNSNGWEIGSTRLKLTDEGKKLFGTPGQAEDVLRIQQVHADHVTKIPEDFVLLASSEKVRIQALAKYYKIRDTEEGKAPGYAHGLSSISPYRDVHIITSQGHPEWGADVIDPLVDEFLKDGKIDKQLAKTAKEYTKKDDDAEHFARALLRILGIIRSETLKAHGQTNGKQEES